MRDDLPTGTVTFLFTDIQGSTRLLKQRGDGYAAALGEHHRLLRQVWTRHEGVEVDTQGDAFFVAFARASDAVAAASAAQAALADGPVRVRIGLHTGEAVLTDTGYVGYDVHRAARIAAAAHGGQTLLSNSTRDLVNAAVRDLGHHRFKDLSVSERIFQLGDGEFPRLKTLFQTNLPVQPNALIGRERELAEVVALLRDGARFLTLTGAGGSGKTRLALHVAAELAGEFHDGVWFVPLAPLSDPQLVAPTVAQAINAAGNLAEHLADQHLLLILDNFEQVLDAAPEVGDAVAAAPGVCVVVTSRERLHLAAEREYEVPTLPLEDGVTLFVQRARRFDLEFAPDDDVVAIVRSLDGLPLAIELAAARAKVLRPAQIRERLGLDVLTGGDRDLPKRQQTLRATIAWSYRLLNEREREVVEALSVFPAGFEIEASEEVAGADLDTLTAIIDKSLLRHGAGGRFFMLATIREFLRERLESGEHAAHVRAAHAQHYLRIGETLDRPLEKQDAGALAVFELEHDNFRAALGWYERNDPENALRLGAAIGRGWYAHGHLEEGTRRLQTALADARAPLPRAKALRQLAVLAYTQGNLEESEACLEQAGSLYSTEGDDAGLAVTVATRANLASVRGDYATAKMLYATALDVLRRVGDLNAQAVIASSIGYVGLLERDVNAHELCEAALALAREVGAQESETIALLNLAFSEIRQCHAGAARRYATQAAALATQSGHREALTYCIEAFGAAAALEHHAYQAARLLGAADSARRVLGVAIGPVEEELDQNARATAQALLSEQAFKQAWQAGAALSDGDAIDYALAPDPLRS